MPKTLEKADLSQGHKEKLVALAEHFGKGFPAEILDIRLFGSRARGEAKAWSDVDVAVILRDDAPEGTEAKLQAEKYKVWEPEEGLPLLIPFCLREGEFRRHQAMRDLLYRDLRDQGIPLWQKSAELWSEEGIEVVGREKDINFELEQAEKALGGSRHLLETDDIGGAASRAYYAAFHSATALLLTEGVERSKHTGLIAEFDRHTAHGRLLGKGFHKQIGELFELRQLADYGKRYISPKAAKDAVETAKTFVDAAKDYCQRWLEQQRTMGVRGR